MNQIMKLREKLSAGKGDELYFEVLLKGTTISVREVMRNLAQGKTVDEVLKANPGMTASDIETCYEYAIELVGAVEFEKSMAAIDIVIAKRKMIIFRLESMKYSNSKSSS